MKTVPRLWAWAALRRDATVIQGRKRLRGAGFREDEHPLVTPALLEAQAYLVEDVSPGSGTQVTTEPPEPPPDTGGPGLCAPSFPLPCLVGLLTTGFSPRARQAALCTLGAQEYLANDD